MTLAFIIRRLESCGCFYNRPVFQAKTAISTRNHYFEIEIVNPGYSCYIAIGLARKNYPKNRHPGWNPGSIAYHADDGKVRWADMMCVEFTGGSLRGAQASP